MTEQLDLAARILDEVRRAAGPVQAEALVIDDEQALTRFANSYIHQNIVARTTTIRLRLHVDGRTATASTSLGDAAGIAALVAGTLATATHAPVDPRWPGLATPAAARAATVSRPDAAQSSPAERAQRVRDFIAAAGGLETAGYCSTTWRAAAFANSAGQQVTGGTTGAAMDGIARAVNADGSRADGMARRGGTRLDEIDGAVLGARAAAKARASVDPVELPPDRYEVVLEPTAVVDVLRALANFGFNGRASNDRRSFAAVGQLQFDSAITLTDDPLEGTPGLPFDPEGTPKSRLALIDAGRTAAVAHDRRTAAEVGTGSTGHACLPDAHGGEPYPGNMRLHPAGGGAAVTEVAGPAADSCVANLVAGVHRGLLVTDNWYTRALDSRTVVMTGLTRNGVWLIEHGELVGAVKNLRFTQSYPLALAPGAVLGVGSHASQLPPDYNGVVCAAPALRLASWNFTGGASG